MNEDILQYKRNYIIDSEIRDAVNSLVDIAYNYEQEDLGICLAASFDLLIACEYYGKVTNKGWSYCCEDPHTMFYTYTNTCPRCICSNKFVYTESHKPESGKIGQISTDILCLMYQRIFEHNNCNAKIFKASEPIDVIVCDESSDKYLLAEIKSAPLITFPLAVECDEITEDVDGERIISSHSKIDNPILSNSKIGIYFPKIDELESTFRLLPLDWNVSNCFFKAINSLCSTINYFYHDYIRYWKSAYNAYKNKNRKAPIYWLTNACGTPSPIPEFWPKRSTGGCETISDAKTSAGMDRTDDIKKGIYQVLKLGADFKTTHSNIKTAILSNLPAIRHYDEYLLTLKDIVWAVSPDSNIEKISDLPDNTPLYNLFDGIISLTNSNIRDNWIREIFKIER